MENFSKELLQTIFYKTILYFVKTIFNKVFCNFNCFQGETSFNMFI
jgi:hypothetical protein